MQLVFFLLLPGAGCLLVFQGFLALLLSLADLRRLLGRRPVFADMGRLAKMRGFRAGAALFACGLLCVLLPLYAMG